MINALFMECTKHLQHVSKEWEIIVIKFKKIYLRDSILTCIGALEPVGDALETILGWGNQKAQKDPVGGPSFGSRFVTFVDTVVVTFFGCFLNHSLFICVLP